jgi:hypothetical protein
MTELEMMRAAIGFIAIGLIALAVGLFFHVRSKT